LKVNRTNIEDDVFSLLSKQQQQQQNKDQISYINVEFQNERIFVIVNEDQRVPMQLVRQILAQLMETPQRVDWKRCVLAKEKEEQIASRLREDLKSLSTNEVESTQ